MLDPAPEIQFFESRNGDLLASRVWSVDQPLAEVVFLHGIMSHGGWYLASCEYLAARGFRVHFLERRGSGLNERERGHVDRWDTWLNDVEDYLGALAGRTPRLLVGISWGGTLAAALARRRPDFVAGLGLVCPGLFSRHAANFVQRAALRLACGLGLRKRRVAIPLRDPALFTNSKRARIHVEKDPLTLRKITLSFAAENQKLVRYATQRPEDIQVPTLLMLAGKDSIVDNPKTRHFFERISHANRTIIEYPQASHTLEFEPDSTKYFHDLTQWCRSIANIDAGER
ncbi:MAG: alpha/beta fold hydrolase [Planctomycetota bacterium]